MGASRQRRPAYPDSRGAQNWHHKAPYIMAQHGAAAASPILDAVAADGTFVTRRTG